MRYQSDNQSFRFAPTDLYHFIHCSHLSLLERELSLSKIERPPFSDPYAKLIMERGSRFEADYVRHLETKNRCIIHINRGDTDKPYIDTLQAMQEGADYIIQGMLEYDGWGGFADILRKVTDKPSRWGDWSYEVMDTKLALETKAGSVMQLAVYTDMLTHIQDCEPEFMYVVHPDHGDHPFVEEPYRYANYAAYYRHLKKQFGAMIGTEELENSYPDPVPHCEQCTWWERCEKQRRDDDHLTYVAGISRMAIAELSGNGITKLNELASKEPTFRPHRGQKETYIKLHQQANIQDRGRTQHENLYELLPVIQDEGAPRKGFLLLPEPSPGDVYLDLESDRFLEDGGLQYLFGVVLKDDNQDWTYQARWALNGAEEKEQFVELIDWLHARREANPDMHIYHFAPYEPATLKRLMTKHNTHIQEVDQLLRGERFIDLYQVLRHAIRASVESYSLKEMERFYGFERETPLQEAGQALRALQSSLEIGDATLDEAISYTVERYNEEDCYSTLHLHRWLEALRNELIGKGISIHRPLPKDGEANEEITEREARLNALRDAIKNMLPADPQDWNETEKAQAILADLVGYFQREEKAAWWEYFRIKELEDEELFQERHVIAGMRFIGEADMEKRSVVHRYALPVQEMGLSEGDSLEDFLGNKIGTLHKFDINTQTVEIKKSRKGQDIHPWAVFHFRNVQAPALEAALCEIAEQIINHSELPPAVADLLYHSGPRIKGKTKGKALYQQNEDLVEVAKTCALGMEESTFPIQGPPGTGKTYTGAQLILSLFKEGKRIGITSLSHAAIRNLLLATLDEAEQQGIPIPIAQKGDKGSKEDERIQMISGKNEKVLEVLEEGKVVGGTVWLWADLNMRHQLDYLIIDEAGQLSLAHVLAASLSAKNLILLGDPQQLEQPQQASHPEGTHISALEYLLNGHATIPAELGIFLDTTRRMHPALCAFSSEQFYEGRLHALPILVNQRIDGNALIRGAGLFYQPVAHQGNSNSSPEEVEAIVKLVEKLTSKDSTWINQNKQSSALTRENIMIIAPYNAQVAALKRAMPECRIGTVDKFQGQEAPVVIYSVTSSSADEAPRGMKFLYHPNRLNVASSRARCAIILIANREIFNPHCHTPEQMSWANGYCRYLELCKEL